MTGLSAMTKIVGEAEADCHAGGMTQRPKQEAVAAAPMSATGMYLKPLLERSTPSPLGGEGRGEAAKGRSPADSKRGAAQRGAQSDKNSPDLIRGPASKKCSTTRAHPEPVEGSSPAKAGAQPVKKTRRKASELEDGLNLAGAK